MSLCKTLGVTPIIELKESDITSAEFNVLANIIDAVGMSNQVMWTSFYPSALAFAHDKYPGVTIIYLGEFTQGYIDTALTFKGTNDVILATDIDAYTTSGLALLKAAGVSAGLYTVNTEAQTTEIDPYFTYVVTNYPNVGNVLFHSAD